jgi:hypothetical protein
MLKLSLKRYSFILSVQLTFLLSDLVFNCIDVFFVEKKSITFLYFLQDSFLLLSLASLIYACYSTYLYQAGLSQIINRNFRVPVLVLVVYILLSITLHFSSLYHDSKDAAWSKAVFVIQKICN